MVDMHDKYCGGQTPHYFLKFILKVIFLFLTVDGLTTFQAPHTKCLQIEPLHNEWLLVFTPYAE